MTGAAAPVRERAPHVLQGRRRGDTVAVGPMLGFDLHGVVGIGLVDASPEEVAVVGAQLGLPATQLGSEPDVVIRFVDRLPDATPVRLLGVNDAGFTEDAFLVLRSTHKVPARVRVPFDAIGGQCEILCERGLPAVPLLIAIVNLTALAKGTLPIHASAFRLGETGVLITGWARGGKTEVLLGFTASGAGYVGDEWIYVDDRRMFGIPEPMRIWDWHLEQMPTYRRLLSRAERARLGVLRHVTQWLDRAAGNGPARRNGWSRGVQRLQTLLNNQRYVHLAPSRLFGRGLVPLEVQLHTVVFVATHDSPEIVVGPADPVEIAERMVFSLQEERAELLSYYRKYLFAFPGRRNGVLDAAEQTERDLLHRFLRGKQCYAALHPYPVPIPALVAALRPVVTARHGGPRPS